MSTYTKDEAAKTRGETALATEWLDKVRAAEQYWEDKWFRRLRENQHYAWHGCSSDWIKGGEDGQDDTPYKVNLVLRHLMNTTADIYAKNPSPEVIIVPRLDHMFWDGTEEMRLQVQMIAQMAMEAGRSIPERAALVIQDIQEAEEERIRLRRYGKVVELVLENAMEVNNFRSRMRKQTFRAELGAVSFVKYGYQREYGVRPEIDNQLEDVRTRLALFQHLSKQLADGEIAEGDAEVERLRMLEQRLLDERLYVLREGLVVFFPRTENIIVDPDVEDFEGFVGARWMAERIDMTPEDVERVYGVDLQARQATLANGRVSPPIATKQGKLPEDVKTYRVYEVYDRDTNTKMTLVDGYAGFLEDPTEPPVEIEDTFPYVALVLKDSDDADNPVPPSEVDLIRDPQDDYNSARQALREHRYVNRPRWITEKGAVSEEELEAVAHAEPLSITPVTKRQDQSFDDVFRPRPTIQIDPNLYSESTMISDIVRSSGAPESAWGSGSTQSTATEATIANDVRSSAAGASIDRIDTFLSELMNRLARVAIREMSEEKVKKIAGYGAAWPNDPDTREMVLERLRFTIKAGSSGKPQKSHELAKLERVAPLLMQIPGISPARLGEALLNTLDSSYKISDFMEPGMPSIMSMNSQTANGGGAMNAPAPATPQGGRSFVSNVQGNQGRAL